MGLMRTLSVFPKRQAYDAYQGTRIEELERFESLCFIHFFHLVFSNTVSVMKEMNFPLSV